MVNLVAGRNGSQQYFSHPLIKKDRIEFRLYQNNIFESVKNKNALVILPTALGKTVVAILVCAEILYNYKSKRVLIMAPTKPLVSQHTTWLSLIITVTATGADLPSRSQMFLEKIQI